MNNYCQTCGLCCKLIPVVEGKMARDGLQHPLDSLIPLSLDEAEKINCDYVEKICSLFDNVTFYSCKYLDNNLCTCYTNRPECCREFPSTPLALIPEECGYSGEIFIKNENLKQKIRRLKEEIIHYEALISSNPNEAKNYLRIIDAHKRFINRYAEFGSADW